jgi:uncharacterized protein (DUF2141 family)
LRRIVLLLAIAAVMALMVAAPASAGQVTDTVNGTVDEAQKTANGAIDNSQKLVTDLLSGVSGLIGGIL